MTALSSRMARLEARAGIGAHSIERAFMCVVRKGREDADRAVAFAELGMMPTGRDLVILHVAVSAKADDRMDGLKPYARVVN